MDRDTCGYCGGRGTVECDCTGDCGSSNANSGCSACGGSGYQD